MEITYKHKFDLWILFVFSSEMQWKQLGRKYNPQESLIELMTAVQIGFSFVRIYQ